MLYEVSNEKAITFPRIKILLTKEHVDTSDKPKERDLFQNNRSVHFKNVPVEEDREKLRNASRLKENHVLTKRNSGSWVGF